MLNNYSLTLVMTGNTISILISYMEIYFYRFRIGHVCFLYTSISKAFYTKSDATASCSKEENRSCPIYLMIDPCVENHYLFTSKNSGETSK